MEEMLEDDFEKLKQSEKKYRQLFDKMISGFTLNEIICDENGKPVSSLFLDVNPAFEKLMGISKDNVIGKTAYEVLPGLDPVWIEIYGKVALTGEPAHFENFAEPIGKYFEVFAFSPQKGQFAVTFIDITKRKHAEEEILRLKYGLEQLIYDRTERLWTALKEMETFSYSVSHDLRAPLRHITGFINLLNNRVSEKLDEKSKHYLKVISDSTIKMGKLVDDVLSFINIGRKEMSITRVSMENLIKDILNIVHENVKERVIIWSIGTLPKVYGDPAMLKIVMTNLISNAVKFTNKQPEARIEIGNILIDSPDEEIFYIKDNGAGFDMKYVNKLFGLFQRLHRVEDFEGTGIGLATIKRIIQRHGGITWAEGELNKGATFYFSLPKNKGKINHEDFAEKNTIG